MVDVSTGAVKILSPLGAHVSRWFQKTKTRTTTSLRVYLSINTNTFWHPCFKVFQKDSKKIPRIWCKPTAEVLTYIFLWQICLPCPIFVSSFLDQKVSIQLLIKDTIYDIQLLLSHVVYFQKSVSWSSIFVSVCLHTVLKLVIKIRYMKVFDI